MTYRIISFITSWVEICISGIRNISKNRLLYSSDMTKRIRVPANNFGEGRQVGDFYTTSYFSENRFPFFNIM